MVWLRLRSSPPHLPVQLSPPLFFSFGNPAQPDQPFIILPLLSISSSPPPYISRVFLPLGAALRRLTNVIPAPRLHLLLFLYTKPLSSTTWPSQPTHPRETKLIYQSSFGHFPFPAVKLRPSNPNQNPILTSSPVIRSSRVDLLFCALCMTWIYNVRGDCHRIVGIFLMFPIMARGPFVSKSPQAHASETKNIRFIQIYTTPIIGTGAFGARTTVCVY